MKPVNLYILACRPEQVCPSAFEKVLSHRQGTGLMRPSEVESFGKLAFELVRAGTHIRALAGFFCSYTIEHIGKEFDLLKIFRGSRVLNIEIKSRNKTKADILDQLNKNAYYLKQLGLPMHLYSWLEEENRLFEKQGKELVEVPFSHLAAFLNEYQDYRYEEDLAALFIPRLYLVSAINSPRRFLRENYFLTSHQNAIQKEIFARPGTWWSVYGEAGTGKTLFLLDCARKLAAHDKVLFIHNGKLQKGHKSIEKGIANLEIQSTRDLLAGLPALPNIHLAFEAAEDKAAALMNTMAGWETSPADMLKQSRQKEAALRQELLHPDQKSPAFVTGTVWEEAIQETPFSRKSMEKGKRSAEEKQPSSPAAHLVSQPETQTRKPEAALVSSPTWRNLHQYRHILVDDAQRLPEEGLYVLLEQLRQSGGYGIFGYDPLQILTQKEQESLVCPLLENPLFFENRRLTRRIRCNTSLVTFTHLLLDRKRMAPKGVDFQGVELLYANTLEQACNLLKLYHQRNYLSISFCRYPLKTSLNGLDEGEALIGQEFDKVLIVVDERFVYENALLKSTSPQGEFLEECLLYQGMARTRQALAILVCSNPPLFEALLDILDGGL